VLAALARLVPILWSHHSGSEVMKPIATPIIGGMLSTFIQILIATAVLFARLRGRILVPAVPAATD